MIARIWHGKVPKKKAEFYYEYLRQTGLKDYTETKGSIGVKVLRKDEGHITHYLLITFWDSFKSIKEFAGEDYGKARYYPEDKEYLLELEPLVQHYEIIEGE